MYSTDLKKKERKETLLLFDAAKLEYIKDDSLVNLSFEDAKLATFYLSFLFDNSIILVNHPCTNFTRLEK